MRRRYVYRPNAEGGVDCIEVTPDYQSAEARPPVYTDRYMEGLRATDGTDISSRGKRREYMRLNGLADADDYKESWAKAEQQRADHYQGRAGTQERREDVARAMHQLSRTPRRQT
ncbi:hypothetical protein [Myxococcus landrumensis]|uniref:Lipoprotein n=1 Tax=Myxococcus landrumensis TaxID=2813577 RepID=A0ABX7N5J7_9BACT|nr:hypothetical protein [Myxococcus landrumus]QSQ14052.1 hypothetical protein JY572_38020 [Myxococcus landrumus]